MEELSDTCKRLVCAIPDNTECYAFFKPFGVVSDHTLQSNGTPSFANFDFPPGVHVAGQLDKDSEGLMIASANTQVIGLLTDCNCHLTKTYLVQVTGHPSEGELDLLRKGIHLPCKNPSKRKQGPVDTKPCNVRVIQEAVMQYLGHELPPRHPEVPFDKSHHSWLEIQLTEGKYRQVRRMTAAIGHPTLRLIRVQIGHLRLYNPPIAYIKPGETILIHKKDIWG